MKRKIFAVTALILLGVAALSLNPTLAAEAVGSPVSDEGSENLFYSSDNSLRENFTIIVLPDAQGYSRYYPWILDNQTQWIVDNKEALNIVFVTQLGDLVDRTDNLTEWENANRSMSKLSGNVPWGVLPGNHDMFTGLTNYNKYFGCDKFSNESWYGGTYVAGDNANSYQLFSAGGDDYLIFHFQYDPSYDVLFWASNIIIQYPERRVIVSTHDYMVGWEKIGQRSDIGERIWQRFIKPNADRIFLVLCGHANSEDLITDTVNGHVVYQLLADYQNHTIVKSGWLRILQFSPEQNKIYVKTYSPLLNEYRNNSQSEFTLEYDLTSATIPKFPSNIALILFIMAALPVIIITIRKQYMNNKTPSR